MERSEEGLPRVVVSPELLRSGFAAGALVELIGAGAPLRAIVSAASEVSAGEAWVDPETTDMLGCRDGEEAGIRSLWYDPEFSLR